MIWMNVERYRLSFHSMLMRKDEPEGSAVTAMRPLPWQTPAAFAAGRRRRAPRGARPVSRSAERHRVLDAALGVEGVQAALEAERREVLLEQLAIIAAGLDGVHGPVVRQADHRAVLALGAEHPV